MANQGSSPVDLAPVCRICGQGTFFFDDTLVLRKYPVKYFRCKSCGFVQTEDPYWQSEAYSSAITKQDVGIMQRNLANAEVTSAVIRTLYPSVKRAIDFGGGHGIFVRLMRDRGFSFDWFDSYASNDYARGFELDRSTSYDFLTAFEVLEHLMNPLDEISAMMKLAPHIFVTTLLLPEPIPKLSDWWYFSPATGQHISFYTKASLEVVAHRFGRHLLSQGPFHLFTTEPKKSIFFRMATREKVARLLNWPRRNQSLTESDHDLLSS